MSEERGLCAGEEAVAGQAEGRGGAVVGVVCHLRRVHGGRCAQAAGSVQPAPGLGVHVPPGPGGLEAVHLGLDM